MWSEFPATDEAQWAALLAKETGGKDLEALSRASWEGIAYPAYADPELTTSPLVGLPPAPELTEAVAGEPEWLHQGEHTRVYLGAGALPDNAQVWQRDAAQPALVCDREQRLCSSGWLRAGADGVQELAWSIAALIDAWRLQPDADAAARFSLRLAASPRLLLETARWRAGHLLWREVAAGFGIDVAPALHLVQDGRWCTRADAHNNLLRGTLAATAAFWGGARSVQLQLIDDTPEAARWSRNIVHLLALESGFRRYSDPTLGSGCVEQLTRSLAEAAWSEVQRIERAGGLSRQTDLTERAAAAGDRWLQQLRDGSATLVGVTRFQPKATPEAVEPHSWEALLR